MNIPDKSTEEEREKEVGGEEKILHIGFDDTDSVNGRCTTHLSFLITDLLIKKFHSKFIDFPLLIRLNPNIPLKTRGNGAVCLRIKGKKYDKIKDEIKYIIENYSDLGNGANPGLVFYEENNIAKDLISWSKNAINTVLSKQLAEKIALKNNVQYYIFGKGYGLVGALAAIGCSLDTDHTYETIAYRKEENTGTIREMDKFKVKNLSQESFPLTYNNFDYKNGRILISPHGPDPVFCGIRGEDPRTTTLFLNNLQIKEELDGYMVFRSNQGTNLHLTQRRSISNILPYAAGYINCQLVTKPNVIQGGHVLFNIKEIRQDNNDDVVICRELREQEQVLPVAVYGPTGLTKTAALLEIEDIIEIGYGVHIKSNTREKTLNLEYLVIKKLKEIFEIKNPICEKCFKSMKSEGKDKGYQCSKCKIKKKNEDKIIIKKDRKVYHGLYIPEPIAHRHLTKPYSRYGMEKTYNKKQISYLLNNTNWIVKK